MIWPWGLPALLGDGTFTWTIDECSKLRSDAFAFFPPFEFSFSRFLELKWRGHGKELNSNDIVWINLYVLYMLSYKKMGNVKKVATRIEVVSYIVSQYDITIKIYSRSCYRFYKNKNDFWSRFDDLYFNAHKFKMSSLIYILSHLFVKYFVAFEIKFSVQNFYYTHMVKSLNSIFTLTNIIFFFKFLT